MKIYLLIMSYILLACDMDDIENSKFESGNIENNCLDLASFEATSNSLDSILMNLEGDYLGKIISSQVEPNDSIMDLFNDYFTINFQLENYFTNLKTDATKERCREILRESLYSKFHSFEDTFNEEYTDQELIIQLKIKVILNIQNQVCKSPPPD